MKNIFNVIFDRFADVGTLLVFLAGALIIVDIISRMLLGSPFAGTADLAAVALVLITFFQASKALVSGRFLQLTLLLEHLPHKLQRTAATFADLVGAALFFGLAYISIEPIQQSIANNEFFGTDAFRVTAWPVRITTALLWVLLAFAFIVKAFEDKREANK